MADSRSATAGRASITLPLIRRNLPDLVPTPHLPDSPLVVFDGIRLFFAAPSAATAAHSSSLAGPFRRSLRLMFPLLTRRSFVRTLLTTLGCSTTGCGTILYPERRGQPAGQLDWGVVLLDGIGLLLFFVPGVIAFAVDFATGAIYLPCDRYGSNEAPSKLRRIPVDRTRLTPQEIARTVSEATGQTITLEPETYETRPIDHLDEFWNTRSELVLAHQNDGAPTVMRSQSPRR